MRLITGSVGVHVLAFLTGLGVFVTGARTTSSRAHRTWTVADAHAADRTRAVEAPLTWDASVDTTAEALWAHLEAAAYQRNWSLWPGTEPYHAGREPHGMLLTTYVNDTMMRGLRMIREGDASAAPSGAIVVKENYRPDRTLTAVTVMYKADGYDASHGDWFWMKRLPDGTVQASGRVGSCIDCHSKADADYLMTPNRHASASQPPAPGE